MRLPSSFWPKAAITLGLITAVALAVHQFGEPAVRALVEYTHRFGSYAPFAYAASGALLIAMFLPASLVFIGSGILFGPFAGSAVAAAATVIGSCISFGVARWLGRPRIQKLTRRSQRLKHIDSAVGSASLRMLWLFRVSPIVPLWLLNLSLGASRTRFAIFLASIPAGFPPIFLYVYSGHTARGLLYGQDSGERSPLEWSLLAVGLVATLVAILRARRAAVEAIAKASQSEPAEKDSDEAELASSGQRLSSYSPSSP